MDRRQVSFSYNVFANNSALSEQDKLLLQHAVDATGASYAPYSKFKVGVAIRAQDHQIITGSNQENGSFPVGQCAERVALYRLSHELGRVPIDSIAIVVANELQESPASPCGSCRQVLNEYRSFQHQPIRLLLGSANSEEIYEIHDVKDLLPFAFDGLFLGQ